MPQAVQCRGAGGEAPGEINFESPPSRREGGRGDGGDKVSYRQGRRATEKASRPCGFRNGKVCRQSAGQVPRQRVIRAPAPVPPGFSPGDARGEAPCIRKLKISPFPPGRGSGGWGQQSKLKAGAAGDKEGKPPLRIPERQGQPTTQTVKPPITPAPHIPPAGRRQCGQNPAGRRDSRRTRARPRRRKWRAERYREHG